MSFFEITVYLIVNLLLFSSWYFLLSSVRKKCSPGLINGECHISFIDRIIGTFVLGLAQIIVTEMILGLVFKSLYAMPLFYLNVFISLIVLILAVHSGNNRFSNPPAPPLQKGSKGGFLDKNIFKSFLLEFRNEANRFCNIVKNDWILLSIFCLVLIYLCYMIFIGWLFPSYTWDALWYHLPIVGHIMQSGAIQENPAPFLIDLFINIFPKNIELFFLWNIIFLESDIIADLSQMLFTIAGVFTVYSIAVKLKIREEHALYSSLLFFFTPIVILQSMTNYIDITVSVLFLIAINFLMYDTHGNYNGSENKVMQPGRLKLPVLLAGITTGILLGSKGSGPIFALVLLAAVVVQAFARRLMNLPAAETAGYPKVSPPLTGGDEGEGEKSILIAPTLTHPEAGLRKGSLRQGGGEYKDTPQQSLWGNLIKSLKHYSLFFILPVFLLGGYWYVKNWVLYNNPVYPMSISFSGITIFKGMYGGIIDPPPQVFKGLTLTAQLFYVWLERVEYYLYDSRLSGFGPVWFILFLPAVVFSFASSIKNKKYDFLFVSAILVLTFLIYPRNWNTRYVIFIIGLGAVSFGLVLDYFDAKGKGLKTAALLLTVYTFFTANSPCITPSKIKEFVRLPAKERTIAGHAPFNIDLQARQEYGYWIWIGNNILRDDTLAHTFEPLFLSPLWNGGFTSKIIYIKAESYNEWLENLKKNNVTYVLIRRNSEEDKWIDNARKLIGRFWWLSAPSEKFKVVYSDENYKIMKFIK
ncbi:MAG: hypothetical protein HY806_01965 [Nitrospirae bacterium]|nr:hypothetical protein [Nitrospirota bacterium]